MFLIFSLILTVFVTFFFSNCAGEFSIIPAQKEFSSHVESESNRDVPLNPDQQNLQKFKFSIEDGENMDSRQILESYLSVLELSVTDIGTDLNSLVSERQRRAALLPQENKSKSVNTVGILSQSSLAGEVCRIFLNKKATTSTLLIGLDLTKTPDKTPISNWVNSFHLFASQAWGRNLNQEELIFAKDFINDFINSVKVSPNLNKVINGYNLESMNLGIMICTAILSSPEATIL